ncbi:hypothetical protein GQ55_2G287400 [Panicum hallii var. hallii]|uniref:Phytocyanin domain-containing protein n=1 Tax=Panicum hallii var. hallii TaxID=1504633 RepID=A0A2T7ETD7_9POAL|nr:hypothetical protein GQ55_2G287400 [Panicum hallii var. hallii]
MEARLQYNATDVKPHKASRPSAGQLLCTKMAASASALVAVLLAAGYAALASPATTHTVGGVHSWMTGVDYAAWASDKTFAVGDKLLFSYVRTDHTVTEVSRSGYDACSGGDARSEDNNSGLTTVTLATPGAHYFICVVPDHCASGMRLAVNVSAAPPGAAATTSGAAGGGLQVPVTVPVVVAAAAATGALTKLALL